MLDVSNIGVQTLDSIVAPEKIDISMQTEVCMHSSDTAEAGIQTDEYIPECGRRHLCPSDTIGGGDFLVNILDDIRRVVRNSYMDPYKRIDYIQKAIVDYENDRFFADPRCQKRVTYVTDLSK